MAHNEFFPPPEPLQSACPKCQKIPARLHNSRALGTSYMRVACECGLFGPPAKGAQQKLVIRSAVRLWNKAAARFSIGGLNRRGPRPLLFFLPGSLWAKCIRCREVPEQMQVEKRGGTYVVRVACACGLFGPSSSHTTRSKATEYALQKWNKLIARFSVV